MDDIIGDQTPASLWLKYSLTRSINAGLRRQFLQHYPDFKQLAALLSSTHPHVQTSDSVFNHKATEALKQCNSPAVRKRVEQALSWASGNPLNQIIGLDHPAYPRLLQTTKNAPPVLYVTGDLESLNTPCIAIVGARKASHNALEQAHSIANELAENGVTVVSGLALGVDAAAHRGALTGGGQTIAVSATGPERIYPRSHVKLASGIYKSGAVITEFAFNNTLQPHCFPRRNRIIKSWLFLALCITRLLVAATS